MEKFSFFDSVNHDRTYFADDFSRLLSKYFTNGIFNNGCQVLANNDMSVTVSIGDANVNGKGYTNDSPKVLQIENADGVANRIDNIVIRLDFDSRDIHAIVVKGEFNEEPSAPELVRNSNVYDLRIAKISIPAGTMSITQDLITDTRLINSDCGNVIAAVQTPDTENLYIQLQAIFDKKMKTMDTDFKTWFDELKKKLTTDTSDLEKFIKDSENSFNTWFDTIKNKLGTDVAGELQNQIDGIVSNLINYYKRTETYSKDEINAIIKTTISIKKVDSLPTEDIKANTIYLVPKGTAVIAKANTKVTKAIATSNNNNYDEYIYVDEVWEFIGSTEVDLSGYVTITLLNETLESYVNSEALELKLKSYAKTTDLPTKLSQLENDLLLKAESEEELITLSQQNPEKFVYTVQQEE